MIADWKNEGYSHLYFGVVRMILSYQGREALPVTAGLALLDSRYLKYSQALLGTCLTTLNAGSAVLTIYPNYTVSLNDPNPPNLLQVQLQITGAEQVASAIMANLHHQVAYRLQNHAFDLPTGYTMGIPIIAANNKNQEDVATLIEAPKAITRDELLFLMPKDWITNYANCNP
jgi:hypothetical protein